MAVIRVTWLLGILLAVFSALATTAAAGPLGTLAEAAPEVQAPPVTEATGGADAAGLARAARPSDSAARPRAGNPLWTVPLTALSATRDRPLFSVSRRPPVVAVRIAPPPPKHESPPPAPERPSLTLIGTIVSRQGSVAMVQGAGAEAVSRLRLGQQNDGWRVRGIGLRSVLVEKGQQSVELNLPRPNGAPAD